MAVPKWWQDAVCYQVYLRSFADSNRDGIGDLPGIIRKLDYLQWLGVNALWVSPFYPSAQFDWGYDVTDYVAIHPEYGALEDFDLLLGEALRRGIRILLDMVLNHTSEEHTWFQNSRSSRENPYRGWYIWQDGVDGGPPNDWESLFGGSAWQYDERTGQYYYHFFFPEQPDLNWRNPEVKEAMFDAMRFWLDRGVDGFRLDAISHIFEREDLQDSHVDLALEDLFLNARMGLFDAGGDQLGRKIRFQQDLPESHDLMRELRGLVDSYGDRVLLGETMETSYYGSGQDELHSVFNFAIIQPALDATCLRQALAARFPLLPEGAWECNAVGNHDRSRSFSLFSDGQHDELRARMALALVMFLRGTPVFYNGEEIGMSNHPPTSVGQIRDGLARWAYRTLRKRPDVDEATAFDIAATYVCRDICRTPMQWHNAPNAGFSPAGVRTWLPLNPNYRQGVNVEDQCSNPASMLSFFRRLIQVRSDNVALRRGEIKLLDETEGALAFWRRSPQQQCLVALNMSAHTATLDLGKGRVRLIFSNYARGKDSDDLAEIGLDPYEIYVGQRDHAQ